MIVCRRKHHLNVNKLMNATLQSRGFSVMELLATVGLVGIVGSITLAVITGTSDRAREMKLKSDSGDKEDSKTSAVIVNTNNSQPKPDNNNKVETQ